jgi:NDP-sugar pyrophosphorylase family protein
MDAMIFAAGLGTRLRPLTDNRPKALVEVGGRPVIEHVARRLIDAGADRLVINTSPFAAQIVDAVRRVGEFGVEVLFSHEPDGPYDTGGGLRHAKGMFRREGPILLHNCDILSDIDLRALCSAHERAGAIATLAVLTPLDERYLIFDDEGLCGYAPRGGGADILVRQLKGEERRHHFAGIQVISPELLDLLPAQDRFSIINVYTSLAAQGRPVLPFVPDDPVWVDIGTHEKLAAAQRLFGEAAD